MGPPSHMRSVFDRNVVMRRLAVHRSSSKVTVRALAHTHTHTGFLPESDPAPVVEFFTRTGITAAGGQFDFERCTRMVFVHRNIV